MKKIFFKKQELTQKIVPEEALVRKIILFGFKEKAAAIALCFRSPSRRVKD
jgi:hypothetical protein